MILLIPAALHHSGRCRGVAAIPADEIREHGGVDGLRHDTLPNNNLGILGMAMV